MYELLYTIRLNKTKKKSILEDVQKRINVADLISILKGPLTRLAMAGIWTRFQ